MQPGCMSAFVATSQFSAGVRWERRGGSGRVIQPSSSPESSDEESDGKPEQPVHDESAPGAWVRQPTVQHPLDEPADYRVQALNPALGVVAWPHTGGLRVCLRRVGQEHTE